MKAIVQEGYGSPDVVLKLRDIATPVIGDDDVLVLDELLAVLRLDAQRLGIIKVSAAVNHLHVAFLGEHGDAAAEFLHD